jgi:hypothetical protein
MTLDEIKARHKRVASNRGCNKHSPSHQDRAQLLAWIEAALPYISNEAGWEKEMGFQVTICTDLLKQMGVKP